MKKLLSLLLIMLTLLGIFSGCTKKIDNSGYIPTGNAILMEGQDPEDILPEEEDDQELALAYYASRSMNPLFGSDYTNRVVMSLIYQGLFAVDSNNDPTPILCSRYQVSSSARTWTFYLETGATFSDGSKVTPQDVVASYQRAMENDYYTNRFYHVTDVEATEDGAIVFYLNCAYQNLPQLLDVPIIKASELDADHPLGTGPYTFEEGTSGAYLQRNTNWWCGTTKIAATDPTINLVEATSASQVRDEFQFGDVSVVCANPQSDSFAEYRCDYELWEIDNGYFMYIGCNITYSDWFEDGTLRTYLTYAIDRATLAQENYNGMALATTLPCSPQSRYYYESLASKYEYDPLKFISLISSYRIPTDDKGVKKTLRLLVNSDDSARVRIARDIAETLTELGLPCNTLECSGSTFRDAVMAANFDIYLGVTKLSANVDMTEFFRPWGEMSWGGIANETLYNMCMNALDDEGNYYNLYAKLLEDGRVIPVLFGYNTVYAKRGLLTELSPSRDNIFYYSLGKTMEGIQIATVYE